MVNTAREKRIKVNNQALTVSTVQKIIYPHMPGSQSDVFKSLIEHAEDVFKRFSRKYLHVLWHSVKTSLSRP